jgi:hypothetical protein
MAASEADCRAGEEREEEAEEEGAASDDDDAGDVGVGVRETTSTAGETAAVTGEDAAAATAPAADTVAAASVCARTGSFLRDELAAFVFWFGMGCGVS